MKKSVFEIIGNGFMYVLTALQTQEIFEIISLILSIVISLLIIASKVHQWWVNAMKDGKLTDDEIKEGIDIVKKEVDDIKNKKDKE